MRPLGLLLLAASLYSVPFKQFHDATYRFGWDINMSPFAGGEDILFVHRGMEKIEGRIIRDTSMVNTKTAGAIYFRLMEMYLGWLPLDCLAVAVQHELFGHGYRIRDIGHGTYVNSYGFDTPPPYGSGGAVTNYTISDSFTSTDDAAVSMAGVESTAILAQNTKLKWLESHWVDPRQTALYVFSQQDLNLYIGTLDVVDDEDLDGHDIDAYVRAVNNTYTDGTLTASRLSNLSWLCLADPFTFYSVYAWFRYVATGRETHIPMIHIYGVGYLPTARLGLSPFGPEIFFENYLLKGRNPIYFYLKAGDHANNTYTGFGTYIPKLYIGEKWRFGLRFDAWRQPKLLLFPGSETGQLYTSDQQHNMHVGLAASIIAGFSKESGFETELGYKSAGFLPGYSLRAAPTARLYYTLVF